MNNRRRLEQATDDEVLAVVEPVRRVTAARVADAERADDVVQETLARTLAVRHRLDRRALTAYAVAVARNLVVSERRDQAMYERHAHRLYEREDSDPEAAELVERREEAAALSVALGSLAEQDRRLLYSNVIGGQDLTALAEERRSTAPALAARVARLRARLRVDYLLNLRHITLPTPRCHAVLVALSLGEGRRRRTISTKEHLNACDTCAGLTEIIQARRRPLGGLLPIGFLVGWWMWLRRVVARHPWHTAAAAGAAGTVAIVAAVLLHHSPPPSHRTAAPPPVQTNLVSVHARVLAVPADEGFWIAQPGGRVWVQMTGPGESPERIMAGQTVTFTGRRVAHGSGFARRVGVAPGPDATALDAQRDHLEVAKTQIRVD